MRNVIFSLIISFLVLSGAAQADVSTQDVSTQCSLDKVVEDGSTSYTQCPVRSENDQLIANDHFTGARLQPDVTISKTPIYVHGECHYIDASGTTNPVFLPFNSSEEWAAFLAHTPTGVHVANCCIARNLQMSDVKAPSQTCLAGAWRLQGLVNSTNTSSYFAVTPSTSSTSGSGISGDISGTVGGRTPTEATQNAVVSLPIYRDDVGYTEPRDGTNPGSFTARWICGNGGTETVPATPPAADANVNAGTVVFVDFRMACQAGSWKTASDCLDRTYTKTETCAEAGHPANWTGSVTVIVREICQGDDTFAPSTSVISDTCSGRAVTGDLCQEGQVGATFTESCPDADMEGVVTKKHYRSCPSGSGASGSVDDLQLSNTCICVPTKDLGNVTKACPSGQTGSIVTHKVRTCIDSKVKATYGRVPVGLQSTTQQRVATTTTISADTCNCSIAETPVSNTCTTTCVSADVVSTKPCLPGQNGIISVHTKHVCDGSNGGAGSDVVTEDNQCHAGCTPGETHVDSDCPAGQSGYIRTTTTRLCSCECGTATAKDTVTVDNQCHQTCTPSSHVTDVQCPTGHTGVIHTTVSHICDGSSNGSGRDTTSTDNQCHVTCTPSTNITCGPCPSGQTGTINTTTSHICDGSNNGAGRDTTSTDNQCHPVSPPPVNGVCGVNSCTSGTYHVDGFKDGKATTHNYNFQCLGINGGTDSPTCIGYHSPLVLDLTDQGLDLLNVSQSHANFDMLLNAQRQHTAWIGPKNGFLVLDRNGNGVIDDRLEMFGDMRGHAHGFEDLATYDVNGDGVIDTKDAIYSKLQVWIDKNGDGVSKPSELYSLKELGITSITVKSEDVHDMIVNGQLISNRGTFTRGNRISTVYDVWFQIDPGP